jgi:WD40 repeat protein
MAIANVHARGPVDWNPVENVLVVAERNTLKFFDTQTWELLESITAHETDIVDIAWSPDGRFLATVALDSTMKVWGRPE